MNSDKFEIGMFIGSFILSWMCFIWLRNKLRNRQLNSLIDKAINECDEALKECEKK
ncbi:MAG TPA: hypothetical protein VII94_03520 [Candidatus Saccharimonadales bacterium]